MRFNLHVGIDYSGAKTPSDRLRGLQVYADAAGEAPTRVEPPQTSRNRTRNWNRREIALWLIGQANEGMTFIAGLDHAFGFPMSYLSRYGLADRNWDSFLDDFCQHWPTQRDGVTVEDLRTNNQRTGDPGEFRLAENWTSSTKSVFRFDVQGQVAKSSHCGIPWLRYIREEVGDQVHFWPFDGWDVPAGKCAIVEVYPSIFRRRYPREGRSIDEQDAYSIAHWLEGVDHRGTLEHYFRPPLAEDEQRIASREGWILGIY